MVSKKKMMCSLCGHTIDKLLDGTKYCSEACRDKARLKRFVYYHANQKAEKKRQRQYAKKNKDKLIRWAKENPEKVKRSDHFYYLKNKKKILARNKKWAKENPEKHKECLRKWRENNKKKEA